MTWVGKPRRRSEDDALIRGQGRFVADISSTMHAAFVRSPVASGRITDIIRPSHELIFTAEDLTGVKPLQARLDRPDFVPVETPLLASECVRHVGEPIALVIAGSRAEAEDIADDVQVFIDAEAPVASIGDALAPNSRPVHDGLATPNGTNVLLDAKLSTDAFDDELAECEHIVDLAIRSHRQSAMPLETRGCVAAYDSRTHRLTVTAATQMPHVLRTALSDSLGLKEQTIRVIAPDVGGAFGQKMCIAREDVVVAFAALQLRSEVSWIEDRVENFTSAWHSRDHSYTLRAGFTSGGELHALDADLICNVGAYGNYPVTFGVEPLMALAELPGPYGFGHYRVRARAVTTNMCPIAPYRGVSRPVLTLSMERLMDTAADQLGIDRVEIRRRNLITEFPHRSPAGLSIDAGSYIQSLDAAVDEFDLTAFQTRQAEDRAAGRLTGVGFSVFGERTGYGTPAFAARGMEITPGYESVELSMDPSGGVCLRIGASPHGQGLGTSISQLLADELGIDPDDVLVIHGDTDNTPYGWGTFASRSAVLVGGATLKAATSLRNRLADIAAEQLEANPADIVFADGQASVAGTSVSVSLQDLARLAHHASHLLPDGAAPGLSFDAVYDPGGTFSNACHLAEVSVDPETGHVTLHRFIVVEDAGVLINPMIVEGQVHGGVAQGIANALYEELVHDDYSNPLTTSMMDYLPPTMAEIPQIDILHLATVTDASITGAKGVGEGGTIGAPAAVLNAITDALAPLGIHVNEMPATPSRLRELIRAAQDEGDL